MFQEEGMNYCTTINAGKSGISILSICMLVLLFFFYHPDLYARKKRVDLYTRGGDTCLVCERVSLLREIIPVVNDSLWPGLTKTRHVPPLVYFGKETSWLAFTNSNIFSSKIAAVKVQCPGSFFVYRMEKFPDSMPFHMENKMTFTDTGSPWFYKPVMFCSNTEKALELISDISSTEDWLQMVMHEYFHSFQFSNRRTVKYLSDKIKIGEDSLDKLYLKYSWFSDALKQENNLLLKGINTKNSDSLVHYISAFLNTRKHRYKMFRDFSGKDIEPLEIFWEKIEGSARYIEYNLGRIFKTSDWNIPVRCDTLFDHFNKYRNTDFENQPWFYLKTGIMPAYYYPTGFNLCRILDKLGVKYKTDLFDKPRESLHKIVYRALRKYNRYSR